MTETDPILTAVQVVYSALRDLSPVDQRRVLNSVALLVQLPQEPLTDEIKSKIGATDRLDQSSEAKRDRAPSLVEVIQDKQPGTHAQRITVFAYYREKYEGRSRFSREDLERYYGLAHETPPGNFARDFVEAVKKGWLHEAGDDSYITTKGIEAVESGFTGERRYTTERKARKPKASATKKSAAKKKPSGARTTSRSRKPSGQAKSRKRR